MRNVSDRVSRNLNFERLGNWFDGNCAKQEKISLHLCRVICANLKKR